jgi:hypothetical protein
LIAKPVAILALVLSTGCSFYNTLLGVRGPAVPVGAAPEDAMIAARVVFERDSLPLMLASRDAGVRVIETASFDPREIWSPDDVNERVTCIRQGQQVSIEGKLWVQFKVSAREYRPEAQLTGQTTNQMGRAFQSSLLVLQYDGGMSGNDTKAKCGPSAAYAEQLLNRIAGRLPPPHRLADQSLGNRK